MPVTDSLPEMRRQLRFFAAYNRHPQTLSSEHVDQFNRLGYVFPLPLLSAAEVATQRHYFDRLLALAVAAGLDNYGVNGWHASCRGLYDLVHHPRILDYVEDLIGPNLVCTMTHYFAKNPEDSKSVFPHQDAQFWPLTPSKVVTAWIAIDDVDAANGAMRLWPESHRAGVVAFEHVTEEEDGVLGQRVHHPERFGEPVSVELPAGQMSLHTDMLLHDSSPNTSGRRRCGLTIRYMPPDVRRGDDQEPRAIIARGSDPAGYWQPIPRPESEAVPD